MRYTEQYLKDIEMIIPQIKGLENIYGKKLLITGATGMVCSTIVDVICYLNQKEKAGIRLFLAGRNKNRIIERFKGIMTEADFGFLTYDASVSQEFNIKIDFIVHGASNANPAIYAREPVETLLGNIIGLNSILSLTKRNPGSRVLYISSSEVYGNIVDGNNKAYKEEDYGFVDILNPRACYPNGKRAAETLCASYRQEYGTNYVVVRPGHIYGPSITKTDTRASASFIKNAASGQDIVMKSDGAQLRSYCYSLDCASAIITVLLNGETGNAYNISNKDSVVSIREMAEALAQASGVNVTFENPSDIEQRSYNLMSNSALNVEKLESLGWKALFGLKEGIEKTLKYY